MLPFASLKAGPGFRLPNELPALELGVAGDTIKVTPVSTTYQGPAFQHQHQETRHDEGFISKGKFSSPERPELSPLRYQHIQTVFEEELFPVKTPVEQRARHWVAMFSMADDVEKKALGFIMTLKQR